ncbi:MAG: hypothetical protein AB9Q23_04660 [Candidatus Reddybacter sp.]
MSKDDDFDGVTFTNCKAEGNGGSGFFFGKGAKAKLDNCESTDNAGGGFVNEGETQPAKINRVLANAIKKPIAGPVKVWHAVGLFITIIAFPFLKDVAFHEYKKARETTTQEQTQQAPKKPSQGIQ